MQVEGLYPSSNHGSPGRSICGCSVFLGRDGCNSTAATSQANRWHADGSLQTLVGVGGDGTAAELVNRTDVGVPITLFPAGNSNLLARYLQMCKDPEFLCRTIVEGVAARLDTGKANGHIFLLMIGCGFDAEVVNRVHGPVQAATSA